MLEKLTTAVRRLVFVGAVAASAAYSSNALAQTTLRVDGDNGLTIGGGATGLTWTSAFKYLQDALTAAQTASPPVQIWVKGDDDSDGVVYYPDEGNGLTGGTQSLSFELRNNVQIYAGFNGSGDDELSDRNLFTNITILSGDLSNNDTSNWGNRSDNSYHVVKAASVNITARLDGFIIRGGSADVEGGGIHLNTAACAIIRCTFIDNQAVNQGGGAYAIDGKPQFINCSFLGNRARDGSTDTLGGGMYLKAAETQIVNTVFTGNSGSNGGAIYVEFNEFPASITDIINSTFTGNTASGSAPAVYATGTTTINNSIFWGTSNQIVTHTFGATTVNHSDYQAATTSTPIRCSPTPTAQTTFMAPWMMMCG